MTISNSSNDIHCLNGQKNYVISSTGMCWYSAEDLRGTLCTSLKFFFCTFFALQFSTLQILPTAIASILPISTIFSTQGMRQDAWGPHSWRGKLQAASWRRAHISLPCLGEHLPELPVVHCPWTSVPCILSNVLIKVEGKPHSCSIMAGSRNYLMLFDPTKWIYSERDIQ